MRKDKENEFICINLSISKLLEQFIIETANCDSGYLDQYPACVRVKDLGLRTKDKVGEVEKRLELNRGEV